LWEGTHIPCPVRAASCRGGTRLAHGSPTRPVALAHPAGPADHRYMATPAFRAPRSFLTFRDAHPQRTCARTSMRMRRGAPDDHVGTHIPVGLRRLAAAG